MPSAEKPLIYADWQSKTSGVSAALIRTLSAALLIPSPDKLREISYALSCMNNGSPNEIHAAMATNMALHWARTGCSKIAIQSQVEEYFTYDMRITPGCQMYRTPPTGQDGPNHVPAGLLCALEATSFEDALLRAFNMGADCITTVATIAGGLAEILHGIPQAVVSTTLNHMPVPMQAVLEKFYTKLGENQPGNPMIVATPAVAPFAKPYKRMT